MAIPFFSIPELLADCAMDLCVLLATQLILGYANLRRLLCAQLMLLLVSNICLLTGHRPGVALQLALYLACAATLTGARRARPIVEGAICIACVFAAAAGLAAAGRQNALLAPMGVILLLFLARRRRNIRCRWNIELYVEKNGLGKRFPALIDTGNRLREHRSNQPVLIVEARAIPRIAALVSDLPDEEKRLLPFGVLGGAGELECFQPDRVEILIPGTAPQAAPPCWLAVFPGRIPGATQALAPPEFADALTTDSSSIKPILCTVRRFGYGVFKHTANHLRHGRSVSQGIDLLHRRKRYASTSAYAGGRSKPRASHQRRRPSSAGHHDRTQPPPRGIHRTEV